MVKVVNTPTPVRVRAPRTPSDRDLLGDDALAFLAMLHRRFEARRRGLLEARDARRTAWQAGAPLGFLPETRAVRAADWAIDPVPADLQDRRVEITGPVDRKMVINALNAGPTHYMADFEDSTAPTWRNLMDGQRNLYEAIRRTLTYTHPVSGKAYALKDEVATLLVRPRGWHLPEAHVTVDDAPMSAALFDFGLYAFHNAEELVRRGTGVYLYLPKLEHHLEAELWDDVFTATEQTLGLARGTVRATVLVETLPAVFQLDEILHALRHHAAGLNCGRWDYIFSAVKTRSHDPAFLLPDRDAVGMTTPFMRAYTRLVVKTCHRRGAHAMGGMAAQIPIKGDAAANDAAMEKVLDDKEREVRDGHDGTWVAHPALVPLAKGVFDHHMPAANQIRRTLPDRRITEADLLEPPTGPRTLGGLRHSLQVGVRYLEAWLRGQGCVPLFHLMEDAATAEICRTQVWQWLRHGAALDDGTPVTLDRFDGWLVEVVAAIRDDLDGSTPDHRLDEAAALFRQLATAERLPPFLTLAAYPSLLTLED